MNTDINIDIDEEYEAHFAAESDEEAADRLNHEIFETSLGNITVKHLNGLTIDDFDDAVECARTLQVITEGNVKGFDYIEWDFSARGSGEITAELVFDDRSKILLSWNWEEWQQYDEFQDEYEDFNYRELPLASATAYSFCEEYSTRYTSSDSHGWTERL